MMTQYALDTTHLTVDHITRVMKVVRGLFLSNSNIAINLSNIQKIDSAGVALLIELENMANKNNATIKFTNIPKIISQLCHLYGVKL